MPGTLTCSSLMVNNVNMPTPAFIRTQLYTTSIPASGNTNLSWNTVLNSGITLAAAPSTFFTIPAIGTYVVSGQLGYVTANSIVGYFSWQQLISSTWTAIAFQQLQPAPANSCYVLPNFIFQTTVANSQCSVMIYNSLTSTVSLQTAATTSFINIFRIA